MPDSLLASAAGRTFTIGLVAPSGYDLDPARVARAGRYFTDRGHRVRSSIEDAPRLQRFAADDDGRLAALMRVVDDPDVDLLMALRGGYGLTRLLPRLDFARIAEAVRARGLRLVGHSDFTALHLALLATTGAVGFAGPMASYDFGGESIDAFTEAHFWQAMEGRIVASFETPDTDLEATGTLWGGNLAMIASLVGTPWMPVIDGGVLFIEDINEHPYRIERMLLQLQQAGVIGRQRLVLCGDFSGYRASHHDQGYDLASALRHAADASGVPFVRGLPFGHCPRKLTLAAGAPVRVSVAGGICSIEQALA